jgi:predicted secreted Zn-dependent protease
VSAAVAKTGLMSYEDLVGAEGVPAEASARRVGDPLPVVVCTDSPSMITSLKRLGPTVGEAKIIAGVKYALHGGTCGLGHD